MIKTLLDMKAHEFYSMAGGFLLPTVDLKQGTEVDVDSKLPVSCMFDVSLAHSNKIRVGFFFKTAFEATNHGGYLITHMQNRRCALGCEVLIKNEDLVLYNYPNRGTLAISPKVNKDIETIFDEQ